VAGGPKTKNSIFHDPEAWSRNRISMGWMSRVFQDREEFLCAKLLDSCQSVNHVGKRFHKIIVSMYVESSCYCVIGELTQAGLLSLFFMFGQESQSFDNYLVVES
jgi:hypothetical protein